ncbi:MAG: SDR family oxidoreductase, partial [Actinobacteria bacterium]|nr:SDR family oxidoreductase [Actinomycetota bacterium]
VARTGVLVNCIAPAVIETPMLGDMSDEHVAYMIERIPLGRMGTADEAASLIAYLASEEMGFSTGACFDLSGGRAVY